MSSDSLIEAWYVLSVNGCQQVPVYRPKKQSNDRLCDHALNVCRTAYMTTLLRVGRV